MRQVVFSGASKPIVFTAPHTLQLLRDDCKVQRHTDGLRVVVDQQDTVRILLQLLVLLVVAVRESCGWCCVREV